VNVADATESKLAKALTEATGTLHLAKHATTAPARGEAALVLVRAMRCMLRRATPEMKTATPPSNA
jgi:hypothetical protein